MNVFELPVHPQADIFPMLPEDEMNELAEDIKKNGLNIPIVLGEYEGEIHLIDGRNRRDACRIAGVEPETQMLNGEDQTAYIASSNLTRRHMTKSQKAMGMAMLYPEPVKYKAGGDSLNIKDSINLGYLSMARTVLRSSVPLAKSVLVGFETLANAYKSASQAEKDYNSNEQRMIRLRNEHPDLAEQVDSEQLSLNEAEAAGKQRNADTKLQRELKIKHFYQLNNVASLLRTDEHINAARDLFENYQEDFTDYTKQSLTDYLAEVSIVAKNISSLKSIIEENI